MGDQVTITFDNVLNFSYIYKNAGASDYTDYAASTAFDLFSDSAVVDDTIDFLIRSPTLPYHNINFDIGTALAATSITLVWEYYKNSVWTAIPSVTDNTNSFQTTGVNSVLFDVPQYMQAGVTCYYSPMYVNGVRKDGLRIRCRISAVSGITEGGRTQNTRLTTNDWKINATNETALTCAALQSASDAGSWMAYGTTKAVETLGDQTIIRTNAFFTGTTEFTATNQTIQIGQEDYPSSLHTGSATSFTLGELDANGRGKNGCMMINHTRYSTSYTYIYDFQAFGSVIRRRTGSYGAMEMRGVFKVVDSVFSSDERWYLSGSVAAGSRWTRSVYADADLLYLYSAYLVIDGFKFIDASQGILCGGSATFSNTDFGNLTGVGKAIRRYYSSTITLIDCINIDKTQIFNVAPLNGADRHVIIKYNINLQVLDEDNNPINSATVTLTDTAGTETFSVTTDSNGDITEQLITAYDRWWEYADSWAQHNDDYNDFTIRIMKDGYQDYSEEKTIAGPVTKSITLKRARIQLDQECLS